MTLTTLTIHAESWLQEELGAQRALLASLASMEAAARTGSSAELERSGRELAALLAPVGERDGRRRVLMEKLALQLALPRQAVTLARLSTSLRDAHVETSRLDQLRAELREVAGAVVKAGRRLAAVAQVHRGILEELCSLLSSGAPGKSGDLGGHLVDARG